MLNTESRHASVLDQGPSRDPWLTTMDWTLGTDQSLQDMLDCDIKSEIDSVIGGHPELGFNFTELSPLELDDDPVGCHSDLNGWFGSQSLLNGNSNSSNSNFNLDLSGCDAASIMVNPNSVMPHTSVRSPTPNNNTAVSVANGIGCVSTSTTSAGTTAVSSTTASTTITSMTVTALTSGGNKRHFAFSPKLEPKEEKSEMATPTTELQESVVTALDLEEGDLDYEQEGEAGDLESEAERDYENEASESEEEEESEYEEPDLGLERVTGLKLNLPPNKAKTTTLLLPASTIKTLSPQLIKPHQQNNAQHTQQALKVNGITGIRLQNLKFLQSPGQIQQLRRQIYNNNVQVQVHQVAQQQLLQQQQLQQQHQQQQQAGQLIQLNASSTTSSSRPVRDKDLDPLGQDYDDKLYPKPAYSYSCLIAMALKNSQTGSLPVSEIYNFMCEHFPYFKTAPNGWKNSVRHNLSLNKCFEKIEKPAGNGNQRKGCLWAINPAKIAKMDEEVQKWSRKDPLAIKKAMIYPEQLELLERGEMKYVGSGDLSEETESSADEVESPEEAVHPHSHSHTLGLGLSLGHGHLAANSVTDSYDESSQDCDVDVSEQLYDEIDIDENKEALHMQLNISKQESSLDYQLSPSSKRQKTLTSTLQANYVYQPVTTARRKAPLYLTTGAAAGSFLKIE